MPLGSWYSQLPPFGWFDPGDRPSSNALGVPDSQQGIALPTRRGLGKWFLVTPPGQSQPYPLQQTDTGPAPWTGRGVDVSAAGAHQMGYTPKNFPTDANFDVKPIDTTGLGLAAGYMGGVPGQNDTAVPETAYAGGPRERRKMPAASLYDMMTGKAPLEFNPQNAAGEPSSFSDALTSRSNSLIGLGLGLLQPSNPLRGQSSWGNALEGYQAGAGLDAKTAQAAAALRERQAERKQSQDNFNRTFAENQLTEAEKLARAAGFARGTPEHAAFIAKAIQSKTEGDWSVAEVPHPLYPDQKVPMWVNRRTRETAPLTGGGAPGTTAVGADTFTSGTAPVYGVGGSYAGSPAAAIPSAAMPSTAATPSGRLFAPPPAGTNYAEYTKEKTKEYVKQQAEQERLAKQAGMIDPVKEDIGRAINVVRANPNLTTGVGGQLLSHVGGTKAADLSGLLDTIKANISFEKLQAMRQASPTGGALGNVSDKDMKSLQAVMGNLEQSKTPEQLLYNLDRIDRMRHEIIHGAGTAPPPRFAPPEEASSSRKTGGGGTGPNADAIRFLKNNPQRRDEFDAKYGEGTAMRYLTGK